MFWQKPFLFKFPWTGWWCTLLISKHLNLHILMREQPNWNCGIWSFIQQSFQPSNNDFLFSLAFLFQFNTETMSLSGLKPQPCNGLVLQHLFILIPDLLVNDMGWCSENCGFHLPSTELKSELNSESEPKIRASKTCLNVYVAEGILIFRQTWTFLTYL